MTANLRRLVPAVVVLVALAVVGVAAAFIKGPASGHASGTTAASDTTVLRQVPVTSAVRACPPGTTTSEDRVTLFAAPASAPAPASASASAPASARAGGSAFLSALPQGGGKATVSTLASQTAASTLSLLPVTATNDASKRQASAIDATGAMAQGVEAELADSSGLGAVRCGEPGSTIWFAGPGQSSGAGQIELYLMNVDSLAATVNVDVITDAGAVQSSNNAGITVPPHGLVTQSLTTEANGASVAAIEVRTSTGRVAADVSEGPSHGAGSWVPSAAPPSTSLVIPGVPPSGSSASLFLVVPGSGDARVKVTAITPQGRIQPFGSQSIDLPGQSASDVQLTATGGSAAALAITANVPVTAAVLVPSGSGSLGTFTAATAPISEQAVIAGNSTSGGATAQVVLSAPAAAARVSLTEVAEGGPAGTAQDVTVPAGRSVVVSVKAPRGARHDAPFTVVITPLAGSGQVYAARIETQDQNTVSILPARSALTSVGLPPVRQSYSAVSP